MFSLVFVYRGEREGTFCPGPAGGGYVLSWSCLRERYSPGGGGGSWSVLPRSVNGRLSCMLKFSHCESICSIYGSVSIPTFSVKTLA